MPPRSSKELKEIRQKLRRSMTIAEKKLWYRINRKQLDGFKFRRQHPFAKRFILDFYCPETGLSIEVDGGVHKLQRQRDEARQEMVEASGIKMIRFKNEEVLNNIDDVIERIRKELHKAGGCEEQ